MTERAVHDDLRHCQDLVLRNADLEELNSTNRHARYSRLVSTMRLDIMLDNQ